MNKKLSKQDIQIIVQVLDKNYILENFNYDNIPEILKKWEVGGVTDPLGQLIEWLWEQISEALTELQNTILNTFKTYFGTFPTDLPNLATFLGKIKSIAENIEGFFGTFPTDLPDIATFLTKIKDIITGVSDLADSIFSEVKTFATTLSDGIDSISTLISDLSTLVTNISTTVENFLKTYFGEFGETLTKGIDTITTTLTTKMDDFSKLMADFETDLASFSDQLGAFGQTLGTQFATWSTQLTSATETLLKSFDDLATAVSASISAGFTKFLSDFSEYWTKVQNFFKNAYDELANSVNNVRYVLQGFTNALGNIWGTLTDFYKFMTDIGGLVSSFGYNAWKWTTTKAIPSIIYFMDDLWRSFMRILEKLSGWIYTGLLNTLSKVTTIIVKGTLGFMEWGQKLAGDMGKPIQDLILGIFTEMGNQYSKWFEDVLQRIEKGEYKGEFKELTILMGVTLGSQFVARYTYLALMWLGEQLNDVRFAPNVAIKILGAGGETTITLTSRLGSILKHLAKEIKEYPDIIGRAMIYGLSIWFTQSLSKVLNYGFRNLLPVSLPTLDMIVEITKRTMATNGLENILKYLKRTFAYWGYSDVVTAWYTIPADQFNIKVTDRFEKERTIPLSLIYTMPSADDFARMMLKDIFAKPEDFFKAMLSRGMIPDLARMYYLLHFRYPALEKLFTFICRISAGFGWVTAKPVVEAELGFPGLSPKGLSDRYTPEGIKAIPKLIEKILPYAKWQDYAPFAWIKDFTADRLIVMDLMADIPTRIDARWMYKWSVISDKDLMRVVLARGMHPDWVEKIAIGEVMNALTEERTIARTPIMRALSIGALDTKSFETILSSLTNVKILDKGVVVKFLKGEIQLLEIRALYDRATDIVKDAFRQASRSYVDNIISFDDISTILEGTIKVLNEKLKLQLTLDKTFLEQVKPYLNLQFEREVVERIRYWIRYMLYQILYRIQTGYLPWNEVQKLIDDLAEQSKMTESEKNILIEVAQFMYNIFTRRTKIDAILNRVSRGVITKTNAVQEIMKFGLSKEDAIALVEKEASIYRTTMATLVTFMERIPLPKGLRRKK